MAEHLHDLVHYVIEHTPPEKLGAVKLNKVLWYADVMHYRLHGTTISGATEYRKNHYGPTPFNIESIIHKLQSSGAIAERQAQTPAGFRREFVWLKPANPARFSPAELETVHKVINWAMGLTAAEISEQTHDALWEETPHGHGISVAAASVQPSEPDDDAIEWARAAFASIDADAARSTA